MKLTCWLGCLLSVGVLAGCGPWERFPGGRLPGPVVRGPVEDWSFTDEHPTIALETRPEFPHSVTTLVFTHAGKLYVPSRNPREKRWVRFVLADPTVRLKIGDRVYPGRALRVTDPAEAQSLLPAVTRKYPRLANRDPANLPEVWFFRIDPPA